MKQGEIRIVQSSMLGSILNILLVLGSCFVASGVRRTGSSFNEAVTSSMSYLTAVATTSLIIPATLYASLEQSDADLDKNILILSHGTAIVMLIVYCVYLLFKLETHSYLSNAGLQQENEDEDEEGPRNFGPIATTSCLVIATTLLAVCAKNLVDGIEGIVETARVSKTFIGLVLLPILGNAAGQSTARVAAYNDRMDLAISIPIGRAMQAVLFVTPSLVVLGWVMDQPMTLHFQSFKTMVLFLSMLVVNSVIQRGKSNYFEGCMCLGTYMIIALAFYVYPDGSGEVGSMVKLISSG
jgi:Ca2+:H+ antiporter